MPITWRAEESGAIHLVFSDPYSITESEKVMIDIFSNPGVTRPLRFLVDVRQSKPPDTDFVVNATNFWQLHIDKMWDAKIAIVAATERQAGMAQISERSTEARQLPFTLRLFHESESTEAEEWLATRT
jgi:hypothetical protein